MNDQPPKISKHHKSQHPNLSFRAFDIIPPHKIKPAASSRPIITTNKPGQPDNTLVSTPVKPTKPTKSMTPEQEVDHLLPEYAEPDTPVQPEATEPTLPTSPATEEIRKAEEKAEAIAEPLKVAASEVSAELSDQIPGLTTPGHPALAPETPETDPAKDTVPPEQNAATAPKEAAESVPHNAQFTAALQEMNYRPKQDAPVKPFVSVHKHFWLKSILIWLVWLIVGVLVAAIVFDLLIDADVIPTTLHPVTNFFHNH